MPLSPADFYAYSQATGAPVADTPEKRARQAPEVHAYRQQQLQAPKEGPSLLDVLGTTAAIAGVGAGAFGLGRLLGRRAVPRQVGKVIIEDEGEALRRARATNVRTEPAPSRVPTTSERQQVAEEFTRQAREERPRGVVVSNIPLEQNIADPWNAPYVRQASTEQRPSVSNVQKFLPEEEYVSPYRKGPTYRDLYPGKVEAQRISPEVLQARRQASAEQLERIRQATPGTYQLELGGEVQPTLRTIRSQEPSSFLTQADAEQLGLVGPSGEYPLNPSTGQPFSYVKTSVPISAKPAQTNLLDYLAGTGRMGTASLVDVHQATLPRISNQAINAVETAEDQVSGRVTHLLQQDPTVDTSQITVQQELPTQSLSSQDLADLAKAHMMSLRQELQEQGFQPGTERFERALAQSWTTKAVPGAEPGTSEFRKLQDLGKVDITLPGIVRKAVESVSAGADPATGLLKERTLVNIGPNAQITQTAAGTAIRGASPSYHEALPKQTLRQTFGTADVLVPGAPDELTQDLPGRSRIQGGPVPEIEEGSPGLSRQEIMYSALDRPVSPAQSPKGGVAGIGVYGLEPGYVPGAMSKATGMYSMASQRRPTEVPAWLLKQQAPLRSGFENVSNEAIQRMLSETGPKSLSANQANIARQELNRRTAAPASIDLSRTIQGIYASGRPTAHQEVQQLVESLKQQTRLL